MKLVMLGSSDPAVVTLQVSLCGEILALLDIVEPGLTRRRAEILRVKLEFIISDLGKDWRGSLTFNPRIIRIT